MKYVFMYLIFLQGKNIEGDKTFSRLMQSGFNAVLKKSRSFGIPGTRRVRVIGKPGWNNNRDQGTAGREIDVSLHQNPPTPSQHYRIEGFNGGTL